MMHHLKEEIRKLTNLHRPDGTANIFILSVPRSGSTWVMELIWSQPGFKTCDEPLDLRNPLVRRHLGLTKWNDLYSSAATPRLEEYFRAFCDGTHHFLDPRPLRRFYRPLTRRIVFKLLHGGEDRANWLADRFNGRIVYLIRHPIPVSLSRQEYPRLETFVQSDYRRHFDEDQLDYARHLLAHGTKMERGVLSWCFQNAIPLKQRTEKWVVLSYEQMVVDPEETIDHLTRYLQLPRPELMMRQLTIPSAVKKKSDPETQRLLEEARGKERHRLIEKWRKRITPTEEERLMSILEHFGIDVYESGNLFPTVSLSPPTSLDRSVP